MTHEMRRISGGVWEQWLPGEDVPDIGVPKINLPSQPATGRGKVATGKNGLRKDKSHPTKERHINPDRLNVKPQEGLPIS